MQPASPPAANISRYKLKQLAHWIRDELDILVARNGPDVLRPDDVLTLHELFVTLRHSTTITALDLRATGIHKAVKDIAGIIGLESVEGGTTYDKNGAYALVLKDTGEVNARSEERFTYRCPMNDKGKFRLTAATPSSREPVRVLRSHSINSIWGPKAGIRYEGIYSVRGWCVRQAKLKDTIGGEWKEGNILYEVTLQRKDPVPMEEVSRRPTNMEIDDYAEYKRLQKLHRENNRKGRGSSHTKTGSHQNVEATFPAPLLHPPTSSIVAPKSLLRASPGVSRTTTFKNHIFDAPSSSQESSDRPTTADVVSPMTIPGPQDSFFPLNKPNSLAIPTRHGQSRPSLIHSSNALREKSVAVLSPDASSFASSSRSGLNDLKEIIPWMDLEDSLPLPTPPIAQPVVGEQTVNQDLERKAAELNPVKNVRRLARDVRQPSTASVRIHKEREKSVGTSIVNSRRHPARLISGKKREKDREGKMMAFARKARLLDGEGYNADEEEDLDYARPRRYRTRSSSASGAPQLHCPIPVRAIGRDRFIAMDQYASIPVDDTQNHGIEDIEFTSPVNSLISRPRLAIPISSPTSQPTETCIGSVQHTEEGSVVTKLRRMVSGVKGGDVD
ncbi:hypothetical protein N0V94_009375 [Neodidymelliopsis sp. IMI 364377]|nr:hypothetical protein N0V94_009375 [Neodidymelliopsis sp. IMI 364377]